MSREADIDRNKIDGLKPENISKNRNTDIVPGLLLLTKMFELNGFDCNMALKKLASIAF